MTDQQNETAQWHVELWCECPKCSDGINIMDSDYCLFERIDQVGEHGTDGSKNYPVVCPQCDHEFKVDFIY